MKACAMTSVRSKEELRREFCENFVREHHPGMADVTTRFKEAHPLVPLGPARRIHCNGHYDWWLETDESMSALGGTWLAHLFDRHRMLDHDWFIGRSDQEPWALVSEPYAPPATPDKIEALSSFRTLLHS
jgi:hypothetical protein